MIQTLLTPLQELRTVLSAPGILGALWLTAQTCLIAGIGFAIFGPMLAWWFARRPTAFSRIASFLTTLPLVFPPVALGYLLLVLLGRNGWIGSWLYDAGIYLIFTPASVALAAFIAGLPLVVNPIQTALEGRQLKAIEFAGAVHGASGWTILRHITLPYVRPQILSRLLLSVSRASGEVGITMMVGGNLSGKTNTLSLEIFNAVSRADFNAAAALCLILSIFTIVIFAILEGIRRPTPPLSRPQCAASQLSATPTSAKSGTESDAADCMMAATFSLTNSNSSSGTSRINSSCT